MATARTARDPILLALLVATLLLLAAMIAAAVRPGFAETCTYAALWVAGFEGFCAALFALGTARSQAAGRARVWILANAVQQALLLGVLVWLERNEIDGGFVFAYPKATAFFLYVFWPSQVLFLVFFAWPYRRWFHTDDDAARVATLLREHGVSRGEDA